MLEKQLEKEMGRHTCNLPSQGGKNKNPYDFFFFLSTVGLRFIYIDEKGGKTGGKMEHVR